MSRTPEQDFCPAAAAVSLAAEAAVLEARLRILGEELRTVDTRIGAVSEALRQLSLSAAGIRADGRESRDAPPEDDGAISSPGGSRASSPGGSRASSPGGSRVERLSGSGTCRP